MRSIRRRSQADTLPDWPGVPDLLRRIYAHRGINDATELDLSLTCLHAPETMAGMAAVTKTLRFYPAVMKVPVRQPLVLAKALSSLAVMSGNRVSLGAGLSPWKEDFTYNGVTWEDRGKRFDAARTAFQAAMQAGGEFADDAAMGVGHVAVQCPGTQSSLDPNQSDGSNSMSP